MWIALTLTCALSLAVSDTLAKSALKSSASAATVGWLRIALTVPFTLPLLLFIEIPELDSVFWAALLGAMPFEVMAMVLYARALKASPMSLTLPFLSLTPVFLLGVGLLILGEAIPAHGGIGIILITVGGYSLNFSHRKHGWLGPVRAIGKEPGSVMMICVALLFSLTASLLKVGINHSSALFYAAIYYSATALVAIPVGLTGIRSVPKAEYPKIAGAGVLMALMLVTNMLALAQAEVAYVVSVKRTSLLFGVFIGWRIFSEENIKERITGAALMLAGFVIVVLSWQS